MSSTADQPIASLYVHVPFCARKCGYCAFYSEPPSRELVDRYVEAVTRELTWASANLKPRTIFFGGGTPSILTASQWETIFAAMERLGLRGADEWTVECNPGTVSLEKARQLRAGGVNRISLGVQSLDDRLLDRLGRIHTRETVFRSFEALRRAGFDNVNLDLMFAIPGQTLPSWRDTLTEAAALQSEHLACYEVTYEEDTPLYAQLQAGEVAKDEELSCAMYEELLDRATAAGFRQYEISNFARHSSGGPAEIPDRACRHNINYWRGGFFHGLGPSATSYGPAGRIRNWANTLMYCEQVEAGRRPIEFSEKLSPLRQAGETAAFGLRMNIGWGFGEFQRVTGFDLRQEWGADMDRLVEQGWAQRGTDRFQLTADGLRFADAVAEHFLR